MNNPVKISLPIPYMSAKEFIGLLDAAMFSDDPQVNEKARAELHRRRREIVDYEARLKKSPSSLN